MSRRSALLILDTTMFAFFAFLMSWRLTGLVLHEWMGVLLIAGILVHLLVHWGWVETRAVVAVRTRRRYIALLLNAGLFVAMGTTLISGLVISKVIFAPHLSPSAYLRWHGLHEDGSNFTMWLIAFHVAYNWDRIRSSLRQALDRARRIPVRPLRSSDIRLRLAATRLLWILGLSAALTAALYARARTGGEEKVMIQYPDGRRELSAPPAGIVERHAQYDWPQLGQGAGRRFITAGVVMLVFGLAGRAVMKRRRRRLPGGLELETQ